jgi:hypothetical protein
MDLKKKTILAINKINIMKIFFNSITTITIIFFSFIKVQGQVIPNEMKKIEAAKNLPAKYFEGKWVGFYKNDTIIINFKRQKSYFKPMNVLVNWLFGEVYINSVRIQSSINKEDTCAILNGLVSVKKPLILSASFYDMNIHETYDAEFKQNKNNTIEWQLKFRERVSVGNNYTRPVPTVPMKLLFSRVTE